HRQPCEGERPDQPREVRTIDEHGGFAWDVPWRGGRAIREGLRSPARAAENICRRPGPPREKRIKTGGAPPLPSHPVGPGLGGGLVLDPSGGRRACAAGEVPEELRAEPRVHGHALAAEGASEGVTGRAVAVDGDTTRPAAGGLQPLRQRPEPLRG